MKPSSLGDQGVERDTVGYALEVDAVDKHFGGDRKSTRLNSSH